MLERSIWATPFPTNTLFPWKLVAPRVHLPSVSEKTDTTSPAFISNDTCKSQDVIHKARSKNWFISILLQSFFSYTLGWQWSLGRRRERLSKRHCHTELQPPSQSWVASQVWEYERKEKGSVTPASQTVSGCMCASILLAVCWRWTAEELDTLELVCVQQRKRTLLCCMILISLCVHSWN